MILFNDFKKQYEAHKDAYDKAINGVLESGWYILGDKVKGFEEDFSRYIGVAYGIGVANGLEAIQIALMALGIGKGDEVITTAHTAAATVFAIQAVGAIPVFTDVDEYYHIDPSLIEEKISPLTKAILPVHMYGQVAAMDEICAFAKKYNLYVIEDCAQAHGATYKGEKVGTFGDVACFSFYPTKNLGAFGDGGMIVTGEKDIYEKCKMIRNYGQKNRYEHIRYGINSRLDELQAAILLAQLPFLDMYNARRSEIAEVYMKQLDGISDISLPKIRKEARHVFHLFVVETGKRDTLQAYLKERGIPTLIHYPIPLHKQLCFSEFAKVSLPVLEKKVERILSLPIHPFLSDEDVRFISASIREFYEK